MQHVVLWERVLTYFQGKALGDASTWIIFLKKFTLFYIDTKIIWKNKIDFYMIYSTCEENY